MSDELEYHTIRARQELDLGYRSESDQAATAHLRLASLHMSKVEGRKAGGPDQTSVDGNRPAIPLPRDEDERPV
jgi:hypothetical protein